jgi:hypothetical protein
MSKLLLFFLLTFLVQTSYAQREKFEFAEGLCFYTGVYSVDQYTALELQNTFENLCFSFSETNTPFAAWEIAEIDKLDVLAKDAECKALITKYEQLDIVNAAVWEQARANRIRAISESCALQKLTIIAYQYPDTLNSFGKSDSLTAYYRAALIAGGDDLLAAWQTLNEMQKARNGNPQRLQNIFDQRNNSPLKLEYARLEVMMFGWWNHANHLIYHDEQNDYWPAFEKLFIKLDSECEEP